MKDDRTELNSFDMYREVKRNYNEAVLFIRSNEFYDVLFGDAELFSNITGKILTTREVNGFLVPVSWFEFHILNEMVSKMIHAGHAVAVCEKGLCETVEALHKGYMDEPIGLPQWGAVELRSPRRDLF